MKIRRGNLSATIETKKVGSIDIYFPHKLWSGELNKGGINWCACGTRTIKETKEFIKALQKAIEIYKIQK